MDLKKLKRIIQLVEDSDLNELEIEEEGLRVWVSKGKEAGMAPIIPMMIPQSSGGWHEPFAHKAVEPGPDKTETVVEAELASITAPMVGTFYRSPSPDSPPFVQVGDTITPDTIVCIVEAMKVMNEIKAGHSGMIKEIPAKNGQPVEYGQPLFLLTD